MSNQVKKEKDNQKKWLSEKQTGSNEQKCKKKKMQNHLKLSRGKERTKLS